MAASEAKGTAVFQVRLSTTYFQPVRVAYRTVDGSARAALDYKLISGTLTFNPGEFEKPINVEILRDTLNEVPETLTLKLSNPVNAEFAGLDTATLTIVDSNVPPRVRFTSDGRSVAESAGSVSVLIEVSQESGIDVIVPYTVGGTAGPNDGTLRSGTAIIPAGSSGVLLRFRINNDQVDEDDELLQITLGTPNNAEPGTPDVHRVTILDDDAADVKLSLSSVTLQEGEETTYTAILNSEPTDPVTVRLTQNDQINVEPKTLTFTATNWNQPQTLTLNAVDDNFDEPDLHEGLISHTVSSLDPRYDDLAEQRITVKVRDNDTIGVAVDPAGALLLSETLSDANHSLTYTLRLTSQPTATVAIELAANADQVVVSPLTLSFTPAAWNIPQRVTVTAVDDPVVESQPHDTLIRHVLSSDDPGYNLPTAPFSAPIVRLRINDNDSAAILLSTLELSVPEDPAAPVRYGVSLATLPAAPVTVTLTITDPAQLAFTPASLVFDATNWSIQQQVTVQALADLVDEPSPHRRDILHVSSSADADYEAANPALTADLRAKLRPELPVNIVDDDTAGIELLAGTTSFTEGGAISYTLRLTSQPLAAVTIALDDAPTGIINPALPTALTFTPLNWSTPQTVTVAAPPNLVDEPDRTVQITHTVTSADSLYNGMLVNPLDVTVLDDDTAGIELLAGATSFTEGGAISYTLRLTSQPLSPVSIAPGEEPAGIVDPARPAVLTFTPLNWNTPQTVTISARDNSVDEPDRATQINHSVASADPLYDDFAVAPFAVTVQDDDTAGVVLLSPTTVFTEGGSLSYTLRLSSEPTEAVQIALAVSPDGIISPALPTEIVFTPADWDAPQTITVAAPNNLLDEPDRSVRITHTVSSLDLRYTGLAVSPLDVTVLDDDSAGVALAIATTVFTEGTGLTYTLRLSSEPTATVRLTLLENPTGVISPELPAELVFTPLDWSVPQTVTVSVPGNLIDEPDRALQITHTISSEDPLYAALAPVQLGLTVLDDDTGGLLITPARLDLAENPTSPGTTNPLSGTFTIRLTSEPNSLVQVTLTPDGQISPDVSALNFTPTNWTIPQTVTVTAIDDQIDEPWPHTGLIALASTSSDSAYERTWPTFPVQLDDDDAAFINVSTPAAPVTSESGGTTGFQVWLASQPTAPVTVTVSTSKPDEGLISTGGLPGAADVALVFDETTWAVPRVVLVTGVDDAIADGHQDYQVLIGNGVSADLIYAGLAPQVSSFNLINNDNEPLMANIGDAIAAFEGGPGTTSVMTFPVTLTRTSPVTVEIDYATEVLSATADDDFAVTTGTLRLAPGRLEDIASVTIFGDDRFEPDELFGLRLTALRSIGDLSAIGDGQGVGTIRNDDAAGVRFASAELIVAENGGPVVITVRLEQAQASEVQVGYTTLPSGGALGGTALAGTDFQPASGILIFPPNTTALTFTLDIIDDSLVGGMYKTIHLSLLNPVGMPLAPPGLATVTIVDDEAEPVFARENFIVTAGPLALTDLGYWYTSTFFGNGYNYTALTVPCGWPTGTPLTIELLSPGMNGPTGQDLAADGLFNTTLFELYDAGTPLGPSPMLPGPGAAGSLHNAAYSPSGPDGWQVFYTIALPQPCGHYLLRSAALDDDENFWGIRAGYDADGAGPLPLRESATTGGEPVTIASLRMTIEHQAPMCTTGWFYLRADTPQLSVRTFDLDLPPAPVERPYLFTDPGVTVRIYPPDAAYDPNGQQGGFAATPSGVEVWHETIFARPESGWWRSVICTTVTDNAYVVEAAAGTQILPIQYTAPTQPAVNVSLWTDPISAAAGELVRMNLNYKNEGTGTAHATALTVQLQPELRFEGNACLLVPGPGCAQTSDRLTIEPGSLPPGGLGTHQFFVRVQPLTPAQQLAVSIGAAYTDALGNPATVSTGTALDVR